MQVTDESYTTGAARFINFTAEYMMSPYNTALQGKLTALRALDDVEDDKPLYGTTFWRQFTTLLRRNFTVAYRDPTLYYLQMFLHSFYGFLIGSAFFQLGYSIGDRINDVFSSIVWYVGLFLPLKKIL